jgi:hypothetical protein
MGWRISWIENLMFDQSTIFFPALSLGHYQQSIETTLGPVVKLVQDSKNDSRQLQQFRIELSVWMNLNLIL